MAELRRHLGLAPEARDRLGVRGQLARHQLHRDAAFEAQLHALVDGAHSALPDQAGDLVRTAQDGPDQPYAWRGGHFVPLQCTAVR